MRASTALGSKGLVCSTPPKELRLAQAADSDRLDAGAGAKKPGGGVGRATLPGMVVWLWLGA